jgi:hypothetical protein
MAAGYNYQQPPIDRQSVYVLVLVCIVALALLLKVFAPIAVFALREVGRALSTFGITFLDGVFEEVKIETLVKQPKEGEMPPLVSKDQVMDCLSDNVRRPKGWLVFDPTSDKLVTTQ